MRGGTWRVRALHVAAVDVVGTPCRMCFSMQQILFGVGGVDTQLCGGGARVYSAKRELLPKWTLACESCRERENMKSITTPHVLRHRYRMDGHALLHLLQPLLQWDKCMAPSYSLVTCHTLRSRQWASSRRHHQTPAECTALLSIRIRDINSPKYLALSAQPPTNGPAGRATTVPAH